MHLVCTTSALICYQSFTNGVHPMCTSSALCVTLSSVSTVMAEDDAGLQCMLIFCDFKSFPMVSEEGCNLWLGHNQEIVLLL